MSNIFTTSLLIKLHPWRHCTTIWVGGISSRRHFPHGSVNINVQLSKVGLLERALNSLQISHLKYFHHCIIKKVTPMEALYNILSGWYQSRRYCPRGSVNINVQLSKVGSLERALNSTQDTYFKSFHHIIIKTVTPMEALYNILSGWYQWSRVLHTWLRQY